MIAFSDKIKFNFRCSNDKVSVCCVNNSEVTSKHIGPIIEFDGRTVMI